MSEIEKKEIEEAKEKLKEENKDNNKEKKDKNITLHEIKFIFLLIFEALLFPFKVIYFSLKGEPKKAFEKLISLLKEEFFQYHKQALFLVFLNTIVFLLFQIKNETFQKILQFIFVSGPWNFYLFNLSFLAHYNLEHFLFNMIFLYNVAYILAYRFNVVKLYFIFGFLINFILFVLSFFMPIEPSLGASGVISALMVIALVYYPFGFSIILFLFYILFDPILGIYAIDFTKIMNLINNIKDFLVYGPVKGQTFVLVHVIGYILGLLYVIKNWKDLKLINRLAFFLLLILIILEVIITIKSLKL